LLFSICVFLNKENFITIKQKKSGTKRSVVI